MSGGSGAIQAGSFKPPPWWVANSRPGANGVGIEWPKVLAEFQDYAGFLHALRARAAERQIAISGDEAHNVAGLSDRRISQMLSLRTLHNIQSVRRIGITSMGPLFGILGVKCVLVEDPEALERFGSRIGKRNENLVHPGPDIEIRFSRKFHQKNARKGGKARMRKLHASGKLASHQRKAAKARWHKPKIRRAKRSASSRKRSSGMQASSPPAHWHSRGDRTNGSATPQ